MHKWEYMKIINYINWRKKTTQSMINLLLQQIRFEDGAILIVCG